jgi:APA family basic amino acid/polyamine antiporter
VIGGVALWRLPEVFPQRYEHSFYRLPMPVLRVVAVGNVAFSLIYTVFVATSAPTALGAVVLMLVVVYVSYRVRVYRHERRGVDIRSRMALLDQHERIGGGADGASSDGGARSGEQ